MSSIIDLNEKRRRDNAIRYRRTEYLPFAFSVNNIRNHPLDLSLSVTEDWSGSHSGIGIAVETWDTNYGYSLKTTETWDS